MSRKHRKFFVALLLAAAFVTSAYAQDARKNRPEPLSIQEQGSFAVGGPDWLTAMRNRNVRAVVAFEPGGDFPFTEGEAMPPITLGGREVRPPTVPVSDFMRLTKIPVVIYYGDNIPAKPSTNPNQEQWRIFLEMARRWRDAVNKRGGNVTLVHLPELGVRGNTHFPMSDLNNLQIADLMSKFLKEKGLD